MSGSSYMGYVLSAAERRRQEAEAKRRLAEEIKRAEEARKREIERKRREQIEREKGRLAAAERLAEIGRELAKKRISRTDTGGSQGVIIERTVGGPGADTVSDMRRLAGKMKEALDAIPETSRHKLEKVITAAETAIREAEEHDFDPYYFHSLTWADHDLQRMLVGKMREEEELSREAEEGRRRCDSLVVQLHAVAENSVLEGERARAADLVSKVEALDGLDDPGAVLSELGAVEPEAQEVIESYQQNIGRGQERDFVTGQVGQVLSEMGYEMLPLSRPQAAESGTSVAYFKTPDGEALKVEAGLDEALHCELMRLVRDDGEEAPSSESEMQSKCRRWCGDYGKLIHELEERSISIGEFWRKAPEEMQFEDLEVSTEDLDEQSWNSYEEENAPMRKETD